METGRPEKKPLLKARHDQKSIMVGKKDEIILREAVVKQIHFR